MRGMKVLQVLLWLGGVFFGEGLRNPGCEQDDLVVYEVRLETHWTRDRFPKQYPTNRPSARWSTLVARDCMDGEYPGGVLIAEFFIGGALIATQRMSHDKDFVLFRIGEVAGDGFKIFAETGRTESLAKINKTLHVFDEFSSSSIKSGAGKTQVTFFADGNHSMVSLAVKIIPSPDWFIGVDSLRLCMEGTWLDSIIVEASPMDAGTDSGFTFTAPNWETQPKEKISKITSKYPRHPANSFYYPKLRDLPVIATFHIHKKRFYRLTKKVEVRETDNEIEATATYPQRKYNFWRKKLTSVSEERRIKKFSEKKKKKKSEKRSKRWLGIN